MRVPRAARLQNSKNAFLALLIALVGMGLVGLIAKFGFRQSDADSFFLAVAIPFGAIFLWFMFSWFRDRREAGSVLLDLAPYPNAAILRILGAIFIVLGLMGASPFSSLKATYSWLFSAVTGVAIGSFWLLMGFGRLQIREGGIWIYANLLKWERIQSIAWVDEGGAASALKFQLEGRVPAFLRRGALPVPVEKKQQLEMILERHLPERAASEKGA